MGDTDQLEGKLKRLMNFKIYRKIIYYMLISCQTHPYPWLLLLCLRGKDRKTADNMKLSGNAARNKHGVKKLETFWKTNGGVSFIFKVPVTSVLSRTCPR